MKFGDVPDCLIENALQIPLCECRALEVFLCFDLLGDHYGLLVLDGRHLLLAEALLGGLIVAEIQLGSDEDDGHAGGVVLDLRVPLQQVSLRQLLSVVSPRYLCLYVVEGRRADDGEANEEHVGLRV